MNNDVQEDDPVLEGLEDEAEEEDDGAEGAESAGGQVIGPPFD